MKEPEWLTADAVLTIHANQIMAYGGPQGVRDQSLLQSALARPANLWDYAEARPTAHDLAAAYAFGIVKNHPFVDGNKRTSFVACLTFLSMQGWEITAHQEERYQAMYNLAAGAISEAEFAAWLERNSSRLD